MHLADSVGALTTEAPEPGQVVPVDDRPIDDGCHQSCVNSDKSDASGINYALTCA